MSFKISALITRIALVKSHFLKRKILSAATLFLAVGVLLSSCASAGDSGNSQTADEPGASTVLLNLPDSIYGLVGQEMNLYFDNLLNVRDTDCDFSLTCGAGEQWERFFRFTPEPGQEGWYEMDFSVYQDRTPAAQAESILKIAPADAGAGAHRSLLVIGDSTVANGMMLEQLLDDFSGDVMSLTLIGTQGSAPVLHEGRSGWTTRQYMEDEESPFLFDGTFDFSQYIAYNHLQVPDYVLIDLGINDLFAALAEGNITEMIPRTLAEYQQMIDSIHACSPNIRIGVCTTIPPAYSQDAFGKAYGCGVHRWEYKEIYAQWIDALLETFSQREAEHVYIVPLHGYLDTQYNMGTEQLPVNARNLQLQESIIENGNCHPSEAGYGQIADAIWYFLKYMEVSSGT